MKAYSRIGMGVALLMLQAGAALAGSETRLGTGGGQELRLPVGPRGTALAGANIGEVNGPEALFFNPAGIAGTEAATALQFSHTQYIADMDINFFGLTQSLGDVGMLGVSVKVLSVGEIPFTSETAPDGNGQTFSPTFANLGLTYAKQMTDRVNFGGTVYYVSEKIMQETAAGVAFDFGFQYETGYHGLKLGLAMKNFGPSFEFKGSDFERNVLLPGDDPQSGNRTVSTGSATFELPSTFQFGGSVPLLLGVNTFNVHGLYQSNSFGVDEGRFGAEFGYQKFAALRAGYKWTSNEDELFNFSYGLGLRVPMGSNSLNVDYAGQLVQDFFDDVHHVSLTMGW